MNFNIHIFGDGFGETIFLEFQNGIGIIDFGSKDFLDWFRLYQDSKKISTIKFLLWTHPHEDHTRYLIDLLNFCEDKQISIEYFFRFNFSKLKPLLEIQDILTEQFIEDSPFNYANTTKPKYIIHLYSKIDTLIKTKLIKKAIYNLSLCSELFPENYLQEKISLHCIAPEENDIAFYKEKFENTVKKYYREKEKIDDEFHPYSKIHNIISIALTIQFNGVNIILGGDVENKSWKKIIGDERYKNYTKSNIVFLKAPHHGSKTAYLKEVWKNWGKDFHTVVTPFIRSDLPKKEIIEQMFDHTTNIYILKDKREGLSLKNNFIIEKITFPYKQITEAKEATHHIMFTISDTGEVTPQWM